MDLVSNSRIQCYKSCRRMYWLKYVKGLVPVRGTSAQERGKSYHEKVEQILTGGGFERDGDPRTNAMAAAFHRFIYPHISATDVEMWTEFKTASGHGIVGRLDGRNGDLYLIEHKTTSMENIELYVNMLEMDEQLMTYMLATGVHRMKYTVMRVPTIRQKKDEPDDEFERRCLAWYEEDPDRRARLVDIYRSEDEIQEFAGMLDKTVTEMENCTLFYRNTKYCTAWGKPCEYSPICASYQDGQSYIGFQERGES